MAFRKAIFTEAFDLLENSFCKGLFITTLGHAVHNPVIVFLQAALAFPRGHCSSQRIGFACSEARCDHRDLHDLLLKDRHAQGSFQRDLQPLARIFNRLQTLTPPQIRMYCAALNRTGPHDRDLDHQIVKLLRPQSRQHRHLRTRFDLKHADSVRLRDHVVARFIVGRNVLHLKALTALL